MRQFFTAFIFLTMSGVTMAQSNYRPTQENIEAREWFDEAKFGLFIHWGVYSVLGDGEWVMHTQNVSINEYEKLPTFLILHNTMPKHG